MIKKYEKDVCLVDKMVDSFLGMLIILLRRKNNYSIAQEK